MTLSSHGPRQLYFNHLVFQRAMGIVIISIFSIGVSGLVSLYDP